MSQIQKKGFFERPESVVTTLSFLGIGLVGFVFLDKILPLVNRVLELALETTLNAALLLIVLAVITWVVTSKDLHKLGWYGYQMVMRKITEIFVTLDPIAILHGYIKTLHRNLKEINVALQDLRGQSNSLRELIKVTAKKLQASQNMAVQAHKRLGEGQKNMRAELMLQSRKAGRLEESNVTYQGLLNRLEAHIAITMKIEEAAKFMVADIEDTVEVETKKREMIRASSKAIGAAKKILAAGEQRELYDMAMESIAKDYSSKLGEIEQFMHDSQHFINTMDLQNGVYEADALAKIEEWEKRSTNLLTGGTGNTTYKLPPAEHHDFAAEDKEIEQKINRGSYADLFGKLD